MLVSVGEFEERSSGLLLLGPIETALAELGYTDRGDVGILVEGWPVQFLPAASKLDEESLAEAVDLGIAGDPPLRVRMLRAEHLVAKAVSVGRLKDLARVEAFLDQNAVDLDALKAVILRFELVAHWRSFCMKSSRADPLQLP